MSFTPIKKYNGILDCISDLPQLFGVDPYNRRQRIQMEEIDKILLREEVKTVYREEYVDRHFIHDFCGHYGSCFQDYTKKCIRLHFFTKDFKLDDFREFLASTDPQANFEVSLGAYIGFIVFRPIPQAILGNVSLKTPDSDEDHHYLTKRVISHLCGLELEVKTIPFQEQDNAISACATAALWMALHVQADTIGGQVPSPHKLTANARKVMEEGIQSHKVTKGLTISQMARAIKDEKLEPLVCVPHSTSYAKAIVKAYLNANIPIVLGIELYYRSDSKSTKSLNRIIGNHAVTVTGWREGDTLDAFDAPDLAEDIQYERDATSERALREEREREEINQLYLESSNIDALYCHDDQIGPYSLLTIPDEYSIGLTTEWTRIYQHGPVDAKITHILIPCHTKVRIRFSNIYEIVKALNVLLFSHYQLMRVQLTWDIRLETVCNLKKQILNGTIGPLNSTIKYELLSLSLPRYIWVVDQYVNEEIESKEYLRHLAATFMFDATDIQNSDYLIKAIHFSEELRNANSTSMINFPYKEQINSMPFIVRKLRESYESDTMKKIVVNF